MRKIIYSLPLKITAVILFIASIVLGALTAVSGIVEYQDRDENVYSFESDFSECWYISYLLNEPEYTLIRAYHDSFPTMNPSKTDVIIAEGSGRIAENIKKSFEDFYYTNELDYYVKFNDLVITNCSVEDPRELMHGEYTYVRRSADGDAERTYTHRGIGMYLEDLNVYESSSEITVSVRVKDEVAAKYERMWTEQRDIVLGTITHTGIYALAALLMLVYLICVCGKKANGEHKSLWIDKIWLEVQLALAALAFFGTVLLCIFFAEAHYLQHFPLGLVYAVVGVSAGLCALVVLTFILSVIRNVKTGSLLKTSVVLRALRWLWKIFVTAVKALWRAMSKKTGAFLVFLLFVYTAIIGLMGILTPASPVPLILAVLLFLFASFIVATRACDTDEIKRGVKQIRSGNTGYKIPELKTEDLKVLAEDVNDIARGLDESVAAKVKAERMKSELITNVSHDLKTPITSIISYAQLLSETEGLSEEARDYAGVISKKGERLKKLTEDLFDVSKVHSGNESAVIERLDMSLLVEQSLAEHEREIESSGLVFCTELTKELFVYADGRKMSRVLGNLIDNILKYTLKNTRVFVSVKELSGDVEIEFKNVSAYPLDFDVSEITGRFVRGDESRSLDGNGLGLAIVKSYTELSGGSFEVKCDGDMFKAIIRFKRIA